MKGSKGNKGNKGYWETRHLAAIDKYLVESLYRPVQTAYCARQVSSDYVGSVVRHAFAPGDFAFFQSVPVSSRATACVHPVMPCRASHLFAYPQTSSIANTSVKHLGLMKACDPSRTGPQLAVEIYS